MSVRKALSLALIAAAAWVLTVDAVPADAASYYKLFSAISRNNMRAVQSLTPGPRGINAVDNASAATPLTWACMAGVDGAVAEWLISKGADPEKKDGYGETPLTTAADYGNPEAARVLLKRGVDPTKPNDMGFVPILVACGQMGHPGVVEALVDHGVRLDTRLGTQALIRAHEFDRPDLIETLKAHGAVPSYLTQISLKFERGLGRYAE
jgi:ankyrin repeat protein